MDQFEIKPYGDSAILVSLDTRIDPVVNARVYQLEAWLNKEKPGGVIEFIPAFCSLMVIYDPLVLDFPQVYEWAGSRVAGCPWDLAQEPRLVEVPVIYGGEEGPDLLIVAKSRHFSPEEVVYLHSQSEYTVAMMGFTPGFVYLGGMDERLATPRLASPRTKVLSGSVGIAGSQTGIYSIASPGGWQIIGRTSLVLFDPAREAPFLFSPGDHVRFVPVKPGEKA